VGKERSSVRNRAEAGLVRLARRLAGIVTPETADAAGRRLGLVFRALDRRRRNLVEENLALAWPGKSAAEIEALSTAVFQHFGGLAVELLHSLDEPDASLFSRIEIVGAEHVRAAADSGRGFFFLTPHLGCWEYAALASAACGFPMTVISRPLDNPILEGEVRRFRERTGNTIVHKAEAAREILKVLRRGGAIGILADQRARKPDAVVVPFFGRPAATTSALARFLDRTDALVLPASCIRVAPARWFNRYRAPFDVRDLPAEERRPEPLTARLNLIMESLIREHPEQWLWLHNRWKPD
jgi:Kdo2-lipid IVA lauroyltransferase/acyltransferase